jgi:hypothetical protein
LFPLLENCGFARYFSKLGKACRAGSNREPRRERQEHITAARALAGRTLSALPDIPQMHRNRPDREVTPPHVLTTS